MQGYRLPQDFFNARLDRLVDSIFEVCRDRQLPLLQMRGLSLFFALSLGLLVFVRICVCSLSVFCRASFSFICSHMCFVAEIMSTLSGRVPKVIEDGIREQLEIYERNLGSMLLRFPANTIDGIIYECLPTIGNQAEQDTAFALCQEIFTLTKAWASGDREYALHIIEQLIGEYIRVEKLFAKSRSQEDAIQTLLAQHTDNFNAVLSAVVSHDAVKSKNHLVRSLLKAIVEKRVVTKEEGVLPALLKELAAFSTSSTSSVALAARHILIQLHLPSYERRKNNMECIFLEAMEDSFSGTYAPEKLELLVNSQTAVFDVLAGFFYHSSEAIVQVCTT